MLAAFHLLNEVEVALHLGAPVELEAASDAIRVRGARGLFEVEAVLAAMGRRPNIDDLGFETLGVPLEDKGIPVVDLAALCIDDLPLFLADDANAYRPLLHEAADEGHIAGRMASPDALHSGHCWHTPLSFVFSSPQVARIDPPLSELGDEGIATGSADFSKQARARMAQTTAGFLRIHSECETGRQLSSKCPCPLPSIWRICLPLRWNSK